MKKVFKMAAFMLCATFMMTACDNTSSNSGNDKTDQFEKKASDFKATLNPGNKIIAERIDSSVQKVFYLEPNEMYDGVNPIKNVMMHDYATNNTQALLPEEEKISDFIAFGEIVEPEGDLSSCMHCFNLDYRSSELFGDRLFMMIHTECSYDTETSLLFYVDVLDNSLHFVCTCDDVKYNKANGTIDIHDELAKFAGADLSYDHTVSATLSDKEYAAKREEVSKIEDEKYNKWREENLD